MVIDPQQGSRAFVAEALNIFEPGFDVVSVHTTQQATEWMDSFVPDLLIIDPTINGAEAFVERLRDRATSQHCRVVTIDSRLATTAEGSEMLERDATLSELLRTVRQVWLA